MPLGVLGKEYEDGEILCRQGESGDRMFVLQSGKAVVVREENNREYVVGELNTGDIFGEMAIFTGEPRSATVKSKGTTRVLALDKRAFMRYIHEDPTVVFQLLREMSLRVRSLNQMLSRNIVWPARRKSSDKPGFLFIVAPEQPALFARLQGEFAQDDEVTVLVDRRKRDHLERAMESGLKRRDEDRRRQT